MRAKTTHGYGSMKKNRGAGNRGGRGLAGTGKRGDANKQTYQANKKYFGKHGFTSKVFNLRLKTRPMVIPCCPISGYIS